MRKFINTIFYLLLLFCWACQEDTIDVDVFGSVEGEIVLESDALIKIGDARISTSPATNTLFSDDFGKFVYEKIKAGTYTLRVEKEDFLIANETFIVYENQTTNLLIKLRPDTLDNQPPVIPELVMPADQSSDQPLTLELVWTASDPDAEDELYYDLLLFDANMSLVEELLIDSRDTSYLLDELSYGATYYWQVIVNDGQETVNGPVWQFSTEPFPDHRFLFARQQDGKYDIFSSDEAGNAIQLTDFPGSSNWRPRMNPQRTKIAFLSNIGIETHMYLMNRDGSDVRRVSGVPVAGYKQLELDFCWSPDGSRILYMQNNRLYTIQPDGSGLQFFADAPAGYTFAECDWTASGNKILARVVGSSLYQSSIYTLNETGAYLQQVLNDVAGATGGAVFSIDGNKMLYTHDVSGFENAEGRQLDARIYIKDLNSFMVNDISINKENGTNDLDARYSADGAWVIFVNTNNDGLGRKDIYKMRIDGSERSLLFENAEMPEWK